MLRTSFRTLVLGLLLYAPISLTGCATQTRTASLPVDPPESFSETGTQDVPERWWTVFENEQLNALVDTALASNFDVRIAWKRLQAAQAVVDRESSALFPDLEGSAQGGVSSSQSVFQGAENIQLGLSSVYEVDLWGRIRSRIEAEQYRAEATFADYQTAAISISAEIVRTWYQLAEAQNQLELIEGQIETNVEMLELLENRFEAGQIRSVDILRQRQLVEATREQRSYAVSRIQVLEHQSAVLLGRPPQEESLITAALALALHLSLG